jgi:hypothetical protein
MRTRTRSSHIRGIKHTLRSAPALELNLVAVTTLLFLGSTAPTATSGVSTSATSFGGAVKIAARPNLIVNPSAPAAPVIGDSGVPGVPERGYGCGCGENGDALLRLDESGVIGVPRDRRDLGRLDVDTPSADCLRCGVDICPGRTRDETVHERGLSEEGVGDVSVFPDKVGLIVVDSLGFFSSSPSFHCKWRITDLVAH